MGGSTDGGARGPGRRGRAGAGLRPVLAGAVALAMLAAACSGGGGEPPGPRRPRRPSGTILGSVGFAGSGLGSYPLPSGAVHPIRLPGSSVRDGALVTASWADAPGSAYALVLLRGEHSQVFQVSTSGPPRPVGPPIGPATEGQRTGDLLLAGVCGRNPGLYLLDLRRPSAWRNVVTGACQGALSPDGKAVAYTPDGRTVWSADVAAGAGATPKPTRLLDLRSEEDVATAGVSRPMVSSMTWGRGGLAMLVSDARGGFKAPVAAVVVRTGAGVVRTIPVSARNGGALPGLAWQPGGDLLAFDASLTTGGAVVKLFDPATARLRVIAADEDWLGEVVWSPNGRAVATQVSDGALLVVDLQGNWLGRIPLSGVAPFDWRT